jgi:hypothetical protein
MARAEGEGAPMTEAEWLACDDPQKMLEFLRGKASDRKLRLFAVACWRRLHGPDGAEGWRRESLRVYERTADQGVTDEELAAIGANRVDIEPAAEDAADAARAAAQSLGGASQAASLRDIFGNPLRPAPRIDPAWLAWNGGAVPGLARAVYDDRAFDRLPVLADALEDAGCSDAELLGHLRGPGPHARGCWAVDLILGKE